MKGSPLSTIVKKCTGRSPPVRSTTPTSDKRRRLPVRAVPGVLAESSGDTFEDGEAVARLRVGVEQPVFWIRSQTA